MKIISESSMLLGGIVPNFPNESELKKIRKIASRAKGTLMIQPDASALDRAKWEMCKKMILHMHKKKLSQRQFAKLLGIPESRMSEVCQYRLGKLTLDRLVRYYECIKPNVMFKVA